MSELANPRRDLPPYRTPLRLHLLITFYELHGIHLQSLQ